MHFQCLLQFIDAAPENVFRFCFEAVIDLFLNFQKERSVVPKMHVQWMQTCGNQWVSGLVCMLHGKTVPNFRMKQIWESLSFSVPANCHQRKSVCVVFLDLWAFLKNVRTRSFFW